MPLLDSAIRAQAKGNDVKRRLLMPPGTRCFLLKRSVESKKFTEVVELTSGWLVKYNSYRDQMELRYATLEPFADTIAQTTFIGYGVPDEDDLVDVYGIDPNRRDIVPPTARDVFWKVFCVRDPKERYEIV